MESASKAADEAVKSVSSELPDVSAVAEKASDTVQSVTDAAPEAAQPESSGNLLTQFVDSVKSKFSPEQSTQSTQSTGDSTQGASAESVSDSPSDSSSLDGKVADAAQSVRDAIPDSSSLGGKADEAVQSVSDTIPDSSSLGGKADEAAQSVADAASEGAKPESSGNPVTQFVDSMKSTFSPGQSTGDSTQEAKGESSPPSSLPADIEAETERNSETPAVQAITEGVSLHSSLLLTSSQIFTIPALLASSAFPLMFRLNQCGGTECSVQLYMHSQGRKSGSWVWPSLSIAVPCTFHFAVTIHILQLLYTFCVHISFSSCVPEESCQGSCLQLPVFLILNHIDAIMSQSIVITCCVSLLLCSMQTEVPTTKCKQSR